MLIKLSTATVLERFNSSSNTVSWIIYGRINGCNFSRTQIKQLASQWRQSARHLEIPNNDSKMRSTTANVCERFRPNMSKVNAHVDELEVGNLKASALNKRYTTMTQFDASITESLSMSTDTTNREPKASVSERFDRLNAVLQPALHELKYAVYSTTQNTRRVFSCNWIQLGDEQTTNNLVPMKTDYIKSDILHRLMLLDACKRHVKTTVWRAFETFTFAISTSAEHTKPWNCTQHKHLRTKLAYSRQT